MNSSETRATRIHAIAGIMALLAMFCMPTPRNLCHAADTAAIHGVLWDDYNGNGSRDEGENFLAGWTVYCDANYNGEYDSGEYAATTDTNGAYTFSTLPAGAYIVREITSAGWGQTLPLRYPSAGRLFVLRGFAGAIPTISEHFPDNGVLVNSFPGPAATGTIGYQGLALGPDRIYYIDGSVTPRKIYELDLETGQVLRSDSVSPLGAPKGLAYYNNMLYISFADVATIQLWDTQTHALAGTISPNPAPTGGLAGATDRGLLFGCNDSARILTINPATGEVLNNTSSGASSLQGIAYVNGVILAGRYYSPGVIYLINPNTSVVIDSFTLTGNGYLAGLGGDDATGDYHRVILAEGQIANDINFANRAALAEIHGLVWNDFDNDGLKDPGEPNVPNWQVYLDRNNNGKMEPTEVSTATNAQGEFQFLNLLPGSYTVMQAVKNGWIQKAPLAGGHAVALEPYEVQSGLEFGDYQQLDHFTWQTIPTPQSRTIPFTAAISARDVAGAIVTGFTGAVSLSAHVAADFEQGLDGYTIDNNFETANGLWHRSSGRSATPGHSPQYSLYYGVGEGSNGGGNFDAGNTEGVATSAPINLGAAPVTLEFQYFLATEGTPGQDLARVEISRNDGAFVAIAGNFVTDGGYSLTDPCAGWKQAAIDISSYAGSQIRIRFHFETMDEIFNEYEGWYVDDILLNGNPIALDMAPSAATNFVAGQWTGEIAINDIAMNFALKADDGQEHTGVSNTLLVTEPTTLHVLSKPVQNLDITGNAPGATNYDASAMQGTVITLTAPTQYHGPTSDLCLLRWNINGEPQTDRQTAVTFTINAETTALAEYTTNRKGDFDGDGDVDFWDFMTFVDVYSISSSHPNWFPNGRIADFDDDESVDFWDFMDFTAAYNT